ncbi:MAG: class I SAM-dependent methyltransferase, partial [Clostridia bacterium]|nr:class I SAM-dependent methyltransferase [Clostridia bacterium]
MYEGLSLFYDILTQDVNYKAIARFVTGRVKRSRAYRDYLARGERPILLDCGCGTGRLIAELRGEFDCIGLDASDEMLDAARIGVPGDDVLWICQ